MKIFNKGLAGEFYVLAQLNARGYDASLTLGNTKGVHQIQNLLMRNLLKTGILHQHTHGY